MNSKKIFWFVLGVMLVMLCSSAQAQQSNKIARIGFLAAPSRAGMAHLTEAFLQGLRELGYVEGKNIAIEYRTLSGRSGHPVKC